MAHSMTAFARGQNQIGSTVICWEIKSVNHRFLEASFRLPESFRMLDVVLRNTMKKLVSRGKLDCQLKINYATDAEQSISINEPLMKAVMSVGERLSEEALLANDMTVSKILSWPGVAELRQSDSEQLGEEIKALFITTLNALVEVRLNEGKQLKAFIFARLKSLKEEIVQTRLQVGSIAKETKEKLLGRLEQLQMNVSDQRVEQEIALLLAKLDVSEEMDRLQAHIDEVERVLNQSEPVGRRLDFLMQELNREANTLSSKSDSAILTTHAVEMKVLIEQMREQIQNIE
jgi:uncharacterized protein (TIGR00255 family)